MLSIFRFYPHFKFTYFKVHNKVQKTCALNVFDKYICISLKWAVVENFAFFVK